MSDCKKPKDKCLKKTNLLVYQRPVGEKTERRIDDCTGKVKAPICTPQPKKIRICTGADLRKMCPPPVCPCEPVKVRRFSFLRLLGFGLKSAIAATAVYITYDMGIWGTPDDTQELYGNACTLFGTPQPKRNDKWDPPSCEAESELFSTRPDNDRYRHCREPPIKVEDTYLKMKTLWNNGISSVFHGISSWAERFRSEPPKNEAKVPQNDDNSQEDADCVSFLPGQQKEVEDTVYVVK